MICGSGCLVGVSGVVGGSVLNFDVARLSELVGVEPKRAENGEIVFIARDDRNQLVMTFSPDGTAANLSVRQADVEYAAVKFTGIELFDYSEEHKTLLLEGEESSSEQARFQAQVVFSPRLEIHSHVKILSDTAIIEGINWHVLENLMGTIGEIAPSGTITFTRDAGERGNLELEIGEEGWSATVAFTLDGERIFNSTIEEVQFFNVSKDDSALVLLAKTGASTCLTRVTLRPQASFSTTVQLSKLVLQHQPTACE